MPFDAERTGFGFENPGEGETNDWITPPRLVKLLGPFDLDPCASVTQPWKLAREQYAPSQDGLSLPWRGRVFCNPPYGPHVGAWARRMVEHQNGVLLIFSRTETEAWQDVWRGGWAFLFPYGRISFFRPDGTRPKKKSGSGSGGGTAPSALIAYGWDNIYALRDCGIAGAFFERVQLLDGLKASKL